MAGALKTLFQMLQASTFLTASSVSLAFGEEMIAAQDLPLPYVTMVPTGGPISDAGYTQGSDPSVERVWKADENIDLYLWANSALTNALPVDHADAVEALRLLVMSAMQDQQLNEGGAVDGGGLRYEVVSQRWETMKNAIDRFGRSLVLTVKAEIPIPMSQAVNATITSLTVTATI